MCTSPIHRWVSDPQRSTAHPWASTTMVPTIIHLNVPVVIASSGSTQPGARLLGSWWWRRHIKPLYLGTPGTITRRRAIGKGEEGVGGRASGVAGAGTSHIRWPASNYSGQPNPQARRSGSLDPVAPASSRAATMAREGRGGGGVA